MSDLLLDIEKSILRTDDACRVSGERAFVLPERNGARVTYGRLFLAEDGHYDWVQVIHPPPDRARL